MNKEQLRANKQKAIIQDALRAAFKGTTGDGPTLHPFVMATQSLRREIEFMEPFTQPNMAEMFKPAEVTYKSALHVLEVAEGMIFADTEVSKDSEQQLPLVEYHLNLLKIHRLLFTRQIEGSSLIPPASPNLQRQVVRTYEALGQLTNVISSLAQPPKAGKTKKQQSQTSKSRSIALKTRSMAQEEPDQPLDLPNRVSPFITDGSKKSTVSIDGIVWPRYV